MTTPNAPAPAPAPTAQRARPINESPDLATLATALLRTPTALAELTSAEARCVVDHMRVVGFAAGATILREGDRANTNYMLLVLTGEVAVEKAETTPNEPISVSVLGPGNVIGEMGLLDGAPRSMTCRAATPVQAAGLARDALQTLIDKNPKVGAKLMIAISQRMAERLRAAVDQLLFYSQLTATMHAELEALKSARRGGR